MTYAELQEKGQQLTSSEISIIEKRIKSDLKIARDNILAKLQLLYDNGLNDLSPEERYNYVIQRNRLETLLNYATEQYNNAKVGTLTTNSSKIGLSNEYYRQQYATQIMAEQLGVTTKFAVLPSGVYQASIYGEFVKDYENFLPKYGGTLTELLSKNKTADIQRIRQAIVSGMINGDSYSKTAVKLKGAFDSSYSNAMRVVRTESGRNMAMGDYANTLNIQEDYPALKVKRMIVAVKDSRTRSQSAQVDGEIENKDGKFKYPNGNYYSTPRNTGIAAYDINDRESVINTVNGENPELERVRNPKTGKTEIVSFGSFGDWAKDNGLTKNVYGEYYKPKSK